jgi:uncharacterized protein YcbK (DUF882 family)
MKHDLASLGVAGAAALGVLQFMPEPDPSLRGPLGILAELPVASASPDAFGRSGQVQTLFAMPGDGVLFPLTVNEPQGLRYRWIAINGRQAAEAPRPLTAGRPVAPSTPGFYRLAITRADAGGAAEQPETVVDAPLLAVMMPFTEKVGGVLNGYRIGTYVVERIRGRNDVPDGFVEVWPESMDLKVTSHLRLSDFVTHDARQETVWPKYVALSPRLLDKLELVIAEVARERPAGAPMSVAVKSGFRTPAHNAGVKAAARDSRHQQGDAADVAIDANADGRLTAADGQLVARAVELVERAHPDLAGGLGLYTSRRYRTPYVHIDARGARARWRG